MRHRKNKLTLDRKTAGRAALLRSLVESLILFEKMSTTKAKAKAAQSLAERLVTMAKQNNLAARRRLLAKVGSKNAVKKLMEVLGPRYSARVGGYTRVTMVKNRVGDGAEEAIVEFI